MKKISRKWGSLVFVLAIMIVIIIFRTGSLSMAEMLPATIPDGVGTVTGAVASSAIEVLPEQTTVMDEEIIPDETIIFDEEPIVQAAGAFKVAAIIQGGIASSIFRMSDWEIIKNKVFIKGVMLDSFSAQNVTASSFGIEYNVLKAMETVKIKKLTLMTGTGLVTFPPNAFTDLMTTFLSGKTVDVANTAILYFDLKKLSASEAFPLGMSAMQKLVYSVGNPVYSNTLRIAVTEVGPDAVQTVPSDADVVLTTPSGIETVQTIPSATLFNRQVVLSWPYVPISGTDTDKLTSWILADDGSAGNAGGRFNFQSGMFQTLVNHFGFHAISSTKVSYKDVATHWAKDVIHRLSSMGIVAGSAGNFRPDAMITRAEFAKMIVLSKKLDITHETSSFSDIGSDDWHNVYVTAAAADGFMDGNADGTFGPSRAVTRQEMAVMIQKALADETQVGDFEALGYEDKAKIAESARASVAIVTDLGIMFGKSGMAMDPTALVFAPTGFATRAEAAAVVYRFLEYKLSE